VVNPDKQMRGLEGLITFGADFEPEEVTYLWKPYLPAGKAILLDADGGIGKTSWCISLAAGGSHGRLPLTDEIIKPFKTLYLIGDADTAEEYETVYRAHNGEPGMISWRKGAFRFDRKGLQQLEQQIVEGQFRLVVIDALFYYLSGVVKDANVALDVSATCRELVEIASRTGCTIIAIRHTSKNTHGKKASELGMGSQAFRAAFRGQLVMRRHPHEPDIIVVCDEKGSVLIEQGEAFAFRRVGERGVIEYIANFSNPFDVLPRRGRPASERTRAAKALEEFLLTKGPTPAKVVVRNVECRTGISRRTIYAAALSLELLKDKGLWSLPCEILSEPPLASG